MFFLYITLHQDDILIEFFSLQLLNWVRHVLVQWVES
jgi:hypothetical protein